MALAHDTINQPRTSDIKINENADFASLLLSEKTLSGLHKSGFRKPSPIQQQAIPIGKCGFDLVIKSKSGTGKTGVFAVIALEMIDLTLHCIQCLIIAPTREIAVQIQGVIETIGLEYTGLKVHSFIGGMPLAEDNVNLQCCHIAVGAPGRLKHLIESGALKTDSIKLLVLDEADKLMETSFYNDINVIYYRLPKCFQMIACSATYPNNLDYYISKYMHTPTHINTLNTETPLLLGLRQFIITVKQTTNCMLEKTRLLIKLLSSVQYTQCIIFSNYQTRVESVSNIINGNGFDSVFISAAQSQPERLAALAKLKSFRCRVILSTDLTARGIDASNVDLVVNYDVPKDVCTYLHRMGRAGRYGSRGLCVTLAENGRELDSFKRIIGFLGGTNMSIAKLINTADWQSDELWKGDLLKFEQISGIVTSISNYEDVQKSLLELKQYTINDNNKKSDSLDTHTPNIQNDNLIHDNTANEQIILKYSIQEIRNLSVNPDIQHTDGIFSKLCHVLEPLIESANLNEANVTKILRRNCKNQIKTKDTSGEINNDTNSKRKRVLYDDSPSNGLMPDEKKNLGKSAVETSDDIFQKNIGVFNITKLLCDESTDVCASISGHIGHFLHKIKGTSEYNTENQTKTNSEHTLETSDDLQDSFFSKNTLETFTEEARGNTEKLFQFAFNYAIDEQKPHWLQEINEDFDEEEFDASREVHVTENLLEDFKNVDFDAMECDDEDYENLHDEELNSKYSIERQDEITHLKHAEMLNTSDYSGFPKEASNIVSSNSRKRKSGRINRRKMYEEVNSKHDFICNSKFNHFFMETGSEFLDKYENYDAFVQFKEFWRNWKDNIHSIRECVQQKIYVEEMLLNKTINNTVDSDNSN